MKYTYEQPQYLDVNGARHLVQELKKYIKEIIDGNLDINDYAKREELKSYATKAELPDMSEYTKTTELPNMEEYAKKAELPDMSVYATKAELPNMGEYATKEELPNMDLYATKSYVDSTVTSAVTSGKVDLTNYYNKQEVDSLIPDVVTEDEIREMFTEENLATETYVDTEIGKIPKVDLSGYYTKDEVNGIIPKVISKEEIKGMFEEENLATETYVDNAIESIPPTDLSNYYTKDEVYNKGETDELISSIGTEPEPEPEPEPSQGGTSSISGYDTLYITFDTTYTGKFKDSSGSDVSDVTGQWDIEADFAESKFTTKTITGNKIKLRVDDESLLGKSFTLKFSDPAGKYTSSSMKITIIEGF